ncbi:uncharacterized protein A1O9_13157, partial [Exophiala aquamarina CBS 119918]
MYFLVTDKTLYENVDVEIRELLEGGEFCNNNPVAANQTLENCRIWYEEGVFHAWLYAICDIDPIYYPQDEVDQQIAVEMYRRGYQTASGCFQRRRASERALMAVDNGRSETQTPLDAPFVAVKDLSKDEHRRGPDIVSCHDAGCLAPFYRDSARFDVLGTEHPSTLVSMNNLAVVLRDQGSDEEAEQIYRQVVKVQKAALGAEHPSTLVGMNNLAVVLSNQGKYEEAEQKHRQVVDVKEVVLGTEHPSTLMSMNNLGVVLSNQGKYEEAEQMHRQVVD